MQNWNKRLLDFISEKRIYKSPFVQRDYDWDENDIIELINDIDEIDLDDPIFKTHELQDMLIEYQKDFSISNKGMTICWLWDGIQRFTTTYLILISIIKNLKDKNDDDWRTLFNQYLVNPDEHEKTYYKIVLTNPILEPIKDILKHVEYGIDYDSEKYVNNKTYRAYQIIDKELSNRSLEDLNLFYKKMNGLNVLFKEGGENDHMPTQFRLTNKRGKPISNYTNIKACLIGRRDENEIPLEIKNYFEKMEDCLTNNSNTPHSTLEKFLKFYLNVEKPYGINKKKNWVKSFEKITRIDKTPENLDERIRDIYSYFNCFELIYTGKCSNKELSDKIKEFRIMKYEGIDYFLFNCSIDYSKGIISSDEFIEIIDIAENYILRMHVCSRKSNGSSFLNKLHHHGKIANRIDKSDYVNSIKKILLNPDTVGNVAFPTDSQFQEHFIKFNWNTSSLTLYYVQFISTIIQNTLADKKHKHIINWNKSKKAPYQIDHIHAKNPKNKNKEKRIAELKNGEAEYEDIKNNYMNTIGNLTPTVWNSEMSDKPTSEKFNQEHGYSNDDLEESKKLVEIYRRNDYWGINEIKEFSNWKFGVLLQQFSMIRYNPSLKEYVI